MSRVGKMPIQIPSGVTAQLQNGQLTINGPKGNLQYNLPKHVLVNITQDEVLVSRDKDDAPARANHGLARSLINNMVIGVSSGYERKLEINGVGYRVQAQGTDLKFNLGYSHDVLYKVPEGVSVGVEQNVINVSGSDKQKVGQVAAEIRALKKPEPYKGKGIKYAEERIIRKSGKSGKE